MQFINEKIRTIFAYEDKKILKEKKLFKLKQNQLISSKTDYNKDFLKKTLGLIFSGDISSKYSCYPSTHNKNLKGMNNLDDFLKDLKKANGEEYCSLFKYFVINFETIIKERKSRIRTKK